MGWRQGIANLMNFIGQQGPEYDKQKQAEELERQKEMNRMFRPMLEYSAWTNPDDPYRRLMEAQQSGVSLPLMKGITPSQFLKLKSPYGGFGGFGGFGFDSGDNNGIIDVDE